MNDEIESPVADAEASHEDAPTLEAQEMTPEQRAEAEQYGRIDLACSLIDRAIDFVFLGVAALLLARPLEAWLAEYIRYDTLRLMALVSIVVALHVLVSLPLSFYSGFVVEHRFGLSKQSFGRWLTRHLKMDALTIAFQAVTFAGLYWLIWTTGSVWWLIAAVFFFLIGTVMSQLLPLFIPLFNKLTKIDDDELAARMDQLAQGTGLSIEGVYNIELSSDTVKAQAMLAGLGPTRRVILGDTLLDHYSHDEIEVVLAHEVGHHVHRHIYKFLLIGAAYSVGGFLLCDIIVGRWAASVGGTLGDVFTAPMLMWVFGTFMMVIEPVNNFIGRVFERQCDRYALDRTGLKDAFVTAFQKLAIQNKDDPNPHRLEVVLFHDHPPIAERIAMAQD
ncbi:MAG: M48 family metallopeptidase [Pirellulales bacterium]|nr:M48 family metallopeptidase [Pirellulales bacterium]